MKAPTLSKSSKPTVEFICKTTRLAPVKDGATWLLMAYPSEVSVGSNQNKGLLQLPGRRGITISAGVSVKVPDGWKLCFTTHEKLAERGGVVVNTGHLVEGTVFLTIFNIGATIIPISEGDVVARAWLEPVHDMNICVQGGP
jgi:dUTPase